MENTTTVKRASTLGVICYGLGDLASQFIWTFVGSYLTIFYTDIVGFAPVIVSGIQTEKPDRYIPKRRYEHRHDHRQLLLRRSGAPLLRKRRGSRNRSRLHDDSNRLLADCRTAFPDRVLHFQGSDRSRL